MFLPIVTSSPSPNIVKLPSRSKSSYRNMTNETRSEILIATEIALWLRMKGSTIYAWAAAGKIPSVKLNGAIRFVRSDIERWIHDRSCMPADLSPMTRPIVLPNPASISRHTIKQAGARAIRRVSGRQSSQQNSTSGPLLNRAKVGERKDRL